MIVQPKYRGFICLTSHPTGCYKNMEDMAQAARAACVSTDQAPKNVLVVGASGGYGLASRMVSAFACGAKTVGVSFEKEGGGNRTATAGHYNNRAFADLSAEAGLAKSTVNGDAFATETKKAAVAACRETFGGAPVDLLVYSLGAPRRVHPVSNITYNSVLKPIGKPYTNKTVDFHTNAVSEITIAPATEEEIAATVQVMGGEDWGMWVDALLSENMLAENCRTLAYTYVGPPLTHPIYRDGTIGKAKDDLAAHCRSIDEKLRPLGGSALLSVNKALVTQSSSAIPVVPLYMAILYKIMKSQNVHEGYLEQITRLFAGIYANGPVERDAEGRIRMDDYEMQPAVQDEVNRLWPLVTSENVEELTDIRGYREAFFSLFGFGRADLNYELDVDV